MSLADDLVLAAQLRERQENLLQVLDTTKNQLNDVEGCVLDQL